jgi:hypothetical protein
VPYVCTQRYDGLGFLYYPIRAGWPEVLSSDERPAFRNYDYHNPYDDRKLEVFFQTWIFFGLLHETLSPYGLFDEREYIGTDGVGLHVHTKQLATRAKEWTGIVRALDQPEKDELEAHLKRCLFLAHESLSVLRQLPKTGSFAPDSNHRGFDKAIKASLVCMCETMTEVVSEAIRNTSGEGEPWPSVWHKIAWDLSMEEQLARNGWCRSDTAHALQNFGSYASLDYLLALRPANAAHRHDRCTDDICVHTQIDEREYSTQHCCQSGDCKSLGPPPAEVVRCLTIGSFPLLRITWSHALQKVAIQTVPYQPGLAYVALSHVWADGLGES